MTCFDLILPFVLRERTCVCMYVGVVGRGRAREREREFFLVENLPFNVDLFLRERESVRERGRAGAGQDRGSKAGSILTAESPMQGSNSQTLR